MGRPPIPRRVGCRFGGAGFRPIGRPPRGLDVVVLGLDEFEALRLADQEGLYHQAAASQMGISRATFGRILASARHKVARALLEPCVLTVRRGPVIEMAGQNCCTGDSGGKRARSRCEARRTGVAAVDASAEETQEEHQGGSSS